MYEQKLEELRREKTPDSITAGRASSGYYSEDRLLSTPNYDRWETDQPSFTCPESSMETPEQHVKSGQS